MFLFLVHLVFSSHLSIVQVIRNRYGNEVVKLMWKFERLNFRCQKLLLGLDLLDNCIGNHIVQKRLNYPDYMLPFELLFPDIKTNDLAASQSNFIKSKFLDTAFTSYNFFE